MMTKLTKQIERRLAKLDALEAGGVDNWDFYDDALKDYRATIQKEETVESIMSDLMDIISESIHEPAGRDCGFGIRPEAHDKCVKLLLERCGELA